MRPKARRQDLSDRRPAWPGCRRMRTFSTATPPSSSWGVHITMSVFLLFAGLKRGHRRQDSKHFMTAALPKVTICARELGDRTSQTGFLRVSLEGCRRTRSFSTATPPVRVGGMI